MALSVGQQAKYWGVAALLFCFTLWYLGNVILPFVLGGALAYCLDPLADFLERRGMSRAGATTFIMLSATVVIVAVMMLVIPLLVTQTLALVRTAPELFAETRAFLIERFPRLFSSASPFADQWTQLTDALQEQAGMVLSSIASTASGLMNILVLIVLVPVVTFYLLLDWDRMVARVDDLLPREHAPTIRRLGREIDRTLASFIRGQGTVCLILGTYYAVALMLVGLNFGLVVGLIAGFLTFIPYVGALVGGALSLGLALYQFWGEWWWIVAVGAIFQFGQIIEGNVLTPKLVGSSVGLHPVWLIFALSVFGALFGFVGMLVAVPVAAVIGVLIRFALGKYKHSALYVGPQMRYEDVSMAALDDAMGEGNTSATPSPDD